MKRLGVIALAKGKRTRWSQSARGVSAMLFIASMMYVADATRALDLKQLRLSVAHVASSSISFVQDPINAVVGVYDGLRELAQLRADNQRMRLEIAELSKWQSRAVLLAEENARLSEMTKMVRGGDDLLLTVPDVVHSAGPFGSSVLVDIGGKGPLSEGVAARTSKGLIGRVHSSDADDARILLINDATSRVPARFGDDYVGLVSGTEWGGLLLFAVEGDARPVVGDFLVTRSLEGILPADIPIGLIEDDLGDGKWAVRPLANLDDPKLVQLIAPPQMKASTAPQ